MTDPEKLDELEARLREGVTEVGLADDNSTELFDIEGANEVMFEAADAIHTLRAQLAAAREGLDRIESQALCAGMPADEAEVRSWLVNTSPALRPPPSQPSRRLTMVEVTKEPYGFEKPDLSKMHRSELEAEVVHFAKLTERFRQGITNIVREFEDEGDRVYLGSTNDADELRELDELLNDAGNELHLYWMHGDDLYATLKALRTQTAASEARIAELEGAVMCLRNGYADAVAGLEYIKMYHGKLSGVGFDRVADHFEQWVTIPEREGLLAGSHTLARQALTKGPTDAK